MEAKKQKSILLVVVLFLIAVATVSIYYFSSAGKSNDESSLVSIEQTLSSYLEGVKNEDIDQVVANLRDVTFSDQESLVSFYKRNIHEVKLVDYKILKVKLVDSTNAEAQIKLNIENEGEIERKFNLIKENDDKWYVYFNFQI